VVTPPEQPEEKVLPIVREDDVVRLRQAVRAEAADCGFSLVDQTKLVTAASELGRNALKYGGGGDARMTRLERDGRVGIRLVFADEGPGIADVEEALKDGFTTGTGLGLGLGGSKRLVNEFEIESAPGRGTRVRVIKWK
jgi:serine/threonine-protein kinase RsbT